MVLSHMVTNRHVGVIGLARDILLQCVVPKEEDLSLTWAVYQITRVLMTVCLKKQLLIQVLYYTKKHHHICIGGLGYDVQRHFQQYFSHIVAVSCIGGGNRSARRKPPAGRKSSCNFIEKFSHILEMEELFYLPLPSICCSCLKKLQ